MALKKEDKVRLEGLEKTFLMLVTNNMDSEQIMTMMQPQFDEFESITGNKLKPNFGDNPSIEVLDLSKDFLRIRYPNDENRVLRTKIQGVGIEVKLFKADEFSFGNSDVASALRALADEVDAAPFELNELEPCDVRDEIKNQANLSEDKLDEETFVAEEHEEVSEEEPDGAEKNEEVGEEEY